MNINNKKEYIYKRNKNKLYYIDIGHADIFILLSYFIIWAHYVVSFQDNSKKREKIKNR